MREKPTNLCIPLTTLRVPYENLRVLIRRHNMLRILSYTNGADGCDAVGDVFGDAVGGGEVPDFYVAVLVAGD